MQGLVKEVRHLRKALKEEKEGINLLQGDIENRMSVLRRGSCKVKLLQGPLQVCEELVHRGEKWQTHDIK